MKKTAQLFCKSNFLFGFANLKSSVARTKAELTFSIQDFEIRYIPYEWNKNTDLSSECLGAISLDIKRIIYKQL